MLRNRSGYSRNDRAGFLVLTKLERDRRADDSVLPLDWRRQAPRPQLPFIRCVCEKLIKRCAEIASECFIGPQKKMKRALHAKGPLLVDQADGRVGGEA